MNWPTDSVRIVLFDATDGLRFLILAESDDPENWKLPGGKFDSVDETPDAAAKRELEEELQLNAAVAPLDIAGTLVNDDGVSARYIFTAKVPQGAPSPSSEIATIQWVTEETIPESRNKGHILSAVRLVRGSS
jgi:ADP-ribose pyrophosphatase YjhB (NUDIX family)